MTQELADVALAFAKECLGWEDAYHSGDGYIVSGDRVWGPTESGDLNAVMEAVRNWRDRIQEELGEYVTVTLSCASNQYIGHVFIGPSPPTTTTDEDPCCAIMSVCVEAARKLKA